MPKFGTKSALFSYFWARISKNYCHIWYPAPSNLSKNESLTHKVNFGIGSAFSKGPGSSLSKGTGPDPGPLYKVWWKNVPKKYSSQIFLEEW